MYFQRRYIKEDQAFVGTKGLVTIDLPNKGLLSCVELLVNAQAGSSTGKPANWIHDALEKVELIVDGSKVIKSLTGEQILAMNLYQGCFADQGNRFNWKDTYQREFFLINLGRFYHDMDYMLDLGKVNDPELRITYDFTKETVNGWTEGQAFATSPAPTFSCIPQILRESDVIPKGYIKSHEVYRFTSAESRKENMILPRGPLYCNLYLQSWYMYEGLQINLDHLELNINNGEVIPFRVGRRDFEASVGRAFGWFTMEEWISIAEADKYPAPLESGWAQDIPLTITGVIAVYAGLFGNTMTIKGKAISDFATITVDVDRQYLFRGFLPYSVAKIPYFNDRDERTWIASKELGDLWLRFEEASGAGTNAIIKLLADEVVTQ